MNEIDGFPIERAPEDNDIDGGSPPAADSAVLPNQSQSPPVTAGAAPAPDGDADSVATPPVPETDAGARVPPYLADIAEEDRLPILTDWISKLSPEERASLPPVQELLQDVEAYISQQASDEDQVQQAERLLDQEEERFWTSVRGGQTANLEGVRRASQTLAMLMVARDINSGLQEVFTKDMGLEELPADLLRKVEASNGFGEAISIYSRFIIEKARAAGEEKAKRDFSTQQKAEEIVQKARLRNEILAELQAQGRLRDGVPPRVAGQSVPVSTGLTADAYRERLARGDLPSEEEIDQMTRRILQGA